MNIVSVSLSDQNLSDLKAVKNGLGLSNSSEVVRACIGLALDQVRSEQDVTGNQNAVLIVLHSHATEKKLSDAKHAFLSLVQSQNHFHSQDHSCIDQFFLSGDAGKIKKMRDRLLAQKEIKKTVLVFL